MPWPMEDGMDQGAVAGLRVAYRRAGQGAPLVLLHGGLADSREWRGALGGPGGELPGGAWDAPRRGGGGRWRAWRTGSPGPPGTPPAAAGRQTHQQRGGCPTTPTAWPGSSMRWSW